MEILSKIAEAWGWVGILPTEIAETNSFGNVIVKDAGCRYWRITPEDLTCEVIAADDEEFGRLRGDPDFVVDWEMNFLTEEARRHLGPVTEDRCYCLKIPGALGGDYGGANLEIINRLELILFSGYLAKQIKDLPDGTPLKLKIVD